MPPRSRQTAFAHLEGGGSDGKCTHFWDSTRHFWTVIRPNSVSATRSWRREICSQPGACAGTPDSPNDHLVAPADAMGQGSTSYGTSFDSCLAHDMPRPLPGARGTSWLGRAMAASRASCPVTRKAAIALSLSQRKSRSRSTAPPAARTSHVGRVQECGWETPTAAGGASGAQRPTT